MALRNVACSTKGAAPRKPVDVTTPRRVHFLHGMAETMCNDISFDTRWYTFMLDSRHDDRFGRRPCDAQGRA